MFAQAVSPQIEKEYVDTGKVRLVFRNWPIFSGTDSTNAAEASYCAQDQDKFWPYHDKLFAISTENEGVFSATVVKQVAKDLSLDTNAFNTCFDTHKYAAQVTKDKTYGASVAAQKGFTGTPAFLINDTSTGLKGADPTAWIANFKKELDAALAK
jgi:protein-disulfide isomerase